MKTLPSHLLLDRAPKRISVIGQVADLLRKELLAGRWKGRLQPERELADHLCVSQPTLRQALLTLQREGLIKAVARRYWRVTVRPRQRIRSKPLIVRLIAPVPVLMLRRHDLVEINEIRRHLHDRGYQLEVHWDMRLSSDRPQSMLENLIRTHDAACWLLLQQSRHVQRWFHEQQVPTIVAGSCHQGVDLPFFDLDQKAIGRHAAGVFLRLGHRHLAFVNSSTDGAGDVATEQGFCEGVLAAGYADAQVQVVRYERKAAGKEQLLKKLAPLFLTKKHPTAVLLSYPKDALTTLMFLLNSGLQVPRDVSLISRNDEDFLTSTIPSIAHYLPDHGRIARRLSRMVIELASTGTLSSRQIWIPAELKKEETLAVVKSA